MGEIRLHVYLARCGVASRRAAETLVLDGKVEVNGEVCTTLGAKIDPDKDSVSVAGRLLKQEEEKVLYRFFKPRGVVTSLSDPHATRTLKDYLSAIPYRVFPIGRLDADVSGLLLLTNDGEFANRLLHPRYEVERIYVARVQGAVGPSLIEQAQQKGVRFDGEQFNRFKLLRPEQPRWKDLSLSMLLGDCQEAESFLEVRVREGSKHFVKRLLQSLGHPVIQLSRVGFGDYELGNLQEGEILPARFT